MKAKSVYNYLLKDSKKSICLFYIVIIAFAVVFFGGVSLFSGNNTNTVMYSYRNVTLIFVFIFGLNSFKENFGMFLQNGVMRKDILKSTAKSFALICALMSVMDFVITTLLRLLVDGLLANAKPDVIYILDLFSQFYPNFAIKVGFMGVHVAELVVFAFGYIGAMLLGYFISMLFYNLSKRGKIILCIGAVAAIYILPLLDLIIFQLKLTDAMLNLASLAFGHNVNPYISVITLTIIVALIFTACYCLIKKTKLKVHE